MNAFFLTHWFPTQDSPVQGIFIREHARAISLYHKVFVVHVRGMQSGIAPVQRIVRETDEDLTVFRIGYPKPKLFKTAWIQRLLLVEQVFTQLTASGSRPDIIHTNVYNTADLAAFLGTKHHLPAVITEHSTAFPRHLLRGTKAFSARFFTNRLQLVMPVSEDLVKHMQGYGIRGPFQPVSNTVDCDLFHPGGDKLSRFDGTNHILVVANLVEAKRIDLLLQAARILKSEGRNFEILIIGDGPLRSNLQTLAEQLEITDRVKFLGQKNKTEVAEYMRQADMLALTSLWENQPVVILEALVSGLPVVAPRIGGIPEILTPFCGRLVEPGDIQSISEQIAALLERLDEYPSDRISAYAREKFSYPAVGKTYAQIYEQVIQGL